MTLDSTRIKHIVLILFSVGCLIIAFSFSPIGQDPSFHNFADQRQMFGVPNFFNVVTNLPFVLIGIVGLIYIFRRSPDAQNLAHLTMYFGVIAIGFGSAWYHYNPTNDTLVWDRIPMTITFMSYFSIVIERYVSKKIGSGILIPLLVIGMVSVFYWYITERNGAGDLRLYAVVQFYPMLCIPLILLMYPASKKMRLSIGAVILVYAVAKVLEDQDEAIFNWSRVISGHSLKHLFASLSVLIILLTLTSNEIQK